MTGKVKTNETLKMNFQANSSKHISSTEHHRWCRWRRRRKLSAFSIFIFLSAISIPGSRGDKVPVPDDCSSTRFEDGLALVCSLSAINSVDEKTNFSVIPSEHTLALTVKCREPTLSQLEADGFRSLKHLKRLTIDGCNLVTVL
jgi:hypothetical protein